MPNPSLKLVTSVIGVGGLATGAVVGVYSYLNKPAVSDKQTTTKEESQVVSKPISEWLDDVVLLKDSEPGDQDQWKTNWGIFIDENNSKNTLDVEWNIQDWTNKKGKKDTVPNDFKTNCDKNSKVTIEKKEGDKYEKVKKYCTKAKPKP